MIPFPNIDPDILHIGPLRIRWYGLMYLLGFLASYFLIQKQDKSREMGLSGPILQDLILYLALGLVIGGRIGYLVFYQFTEYAYYLKHPIEIIAIWHGGMSFHGGLLGALVAGSWFCRRKGLPFWSTADRVFVTVPIGLGLGRLGNFINGELFGRMSDVPWAMVFPAGGPLPRHPSQLYEALLEGFLLFAVLWRLNKKGFSDGMMVVFFLAGYGICRFMLEYFRAPDPQLGVLWLGLSMGQWLCGLMILVAICLAVMLKKRNLG
jgi:phosphatidylglycerol:prolipoprotein diacylglycerol transferase